MKVKVRGGILSVVKGLCWGGKSCKAGWSLSR